MDDTALLPRLLTRDPIAERAFYDAHVDRVYRLAYRLAGSDELAREICQDTFVRAFAGIAGFRGEASFATWLHRITTSVALNTLRSAQRFRQRFTSLDDDDAAPSAATSGSAPDPHLQQHLSAAIHALPEGYRTVFLMHDVEGYSHDDIAAALGVHVGTSKAQLFRARAKLREALAPYRAQEAG